MVSAAKKEFHEREEVVRMQHETIKLISDLGIPKAMIAGAAEVNPARVSDYVRRRQVTPAVAERIETATQKIAFVWSAFQKAEPGLKIVLDNPQLLDRMVAACKQGIEEQTRTPLERLDRALREALPELAASS